MRWYDWTLIGTTALFFILFVICWKIGWDWMCKYEEATKEARDWKNAFLDQKNGHNNVGSPGPMPGHLSISGRP